jgi:hypothetical protein
MPAAKKATEKAPEPTAEDKTLWDVGKWWVREQRYGDSADLAMALKTWADAKGLEEQE